MDFILTTKEELSEIMETVFRSVLADKKLVTPAEGLKPVKEILNLAEACQFLSLSKNTIYGYTSNGTIPFFKRKRKLYFYRSELLVWIDEARQMSVEQELERVNEMLTKNNKGK